MPVPENEVAVGKVYKTATGALRKVTQIDGDKVHYMKKSADTPSKWAPGHNKSSPPTIKKFAEEVDHFSERLKIELRPAPEEGPRSNAEHQKALGDFAETMRSHGVEVIPRYYVHDAVGGGGGLSGEFTVITTALTVLGTVLGAWLNSRYGRKAKLKIGDVEAEAQTVEEVEKLIKLAEKQHKSSSHE